MTTLISMNKTEYINFVEKLKKEINTDIAPKTIPSERIQDYIARSLGYHGHVDALSYFDNHLKEKEAQNFLFKRDFYHYLSLQYKNEDTWAPRVLLLVQLLFLIAEYKNYKLSNRSIVRLLPADVLIKFYKDKKTPENIKIKIEEYFKELPGFTTIRQINKSIKEQHQFNFPYILIASKMYEAKKRQAPTENENK